jgi:3-oxoacyl-[acyl-carrier protein] reductase
MNSTDTSAQAKPTDDFLRFAGKVALITGTSDRGIGGEIAVRLAREGAAVAMISRQTPARLLKKVNRFEHGAVHTVGDVTKSADVQRAIDDCMGEFGKIDIVVNNAGVEVARPLEQFGEEEWRQLLDVNLHGAIAVTRAALPVLSAPGGRDREHRVGAGARRVCGVFGL